jgi:hypothetical protein
MDKFKNLLSVKASHYILGGFGVVTALSWNNTVRDCVEKLAPSPKGQVCANILYSIIITLVLILLVLLLPDTKAELPVETRERLNQL